MQRQTKPLRVEGSMLASKKPFSSRLAPLVHKSGYDKPRILSPHARHTTRPDSEVVRTFCPWISGTLRRAGPLIIQNLRCWSRKVTSRTGSKGNFVPPSSHVSPRCRSPTKALCGRARNASGSLTPNRKQNNSPPHRSTTIPSSADPPSTKPVCART